MSKRRGKLKQKHRKETEQQRWAKRPVRRRIDPPDYGSGMELAMAAMAMVGKLSKK